MINKEAHSRPVFRELDTAECLALHGIYTLYPLLAKFKDHHEKGGSQSLGAEAVDAYQKKVFSGHRRIATHMNSQW